MEVPVRTLPIVEQWDCHQCGICCKAHTVLLDAEDRARLREQHWEQHPLYQGVKTIVRVGPFRRQYALAQRADGSCVFLTDQGLCRIHAEYGESAKPWACRMFPFQLIPANGHLRLTMRRCCPSAAANKGRPLAEHLPAVLALADKAIPQVPRGRPGHPIGPPAIVAGHRRSWPETMRVAQVVERWMLDASLPPVRRIVIALGFCERLAGAHVDRLDDQSLRALLPTLERAARESVGAAFQDRRAPDGLAALLFRQAAAEYARHHPNLGDRPGPLGRLRWLWAALRMVRGQGPVPRIHPALPQTTFTDLERPLGNLPPAVMDPICGFFEAAVASMQYCGAGRFGWPLVDGFRALALAYPIGMWLLRWLASGREPTPANAIEVVAMLDRSHYLPLLARRRQRARLAMISRLGQLERLIVWYAR